MGKGKRVGRRAPYMVFVSHATTDKWIARVLCEKIESTGAVTFRDDRDIAGGDDIPESIRVAIKQSRELIVLLTPHSIDREWVRLEVGAAWGWRKDFRIVAVLCHVDVGVIPAMIKGRKAITLNEFDDYVRELKSRLTEHQK
ncbi:MAG TPA: toll/interleukin-1 receptor domain-containing protein [Humisphaera sp.]|jgi:hypothetical protein|nr:toll/interleukin-1 receptor domain-containing protein [Humisphaera sp.]